MDWTKEALTFKWYEEPENWDRLCPADDDDMDEMKTRYRELYLSFLRLDKLKKTTTTRKRTGSPGRSKTCRALAEGVRQRLDGARLVKCSEKLRTLKEVTSSERGQTTSTSDPVKNPIPTKTKSRKSQTDVGNSDDIPLLSTSATADKSHMTPTMCGQSATPTNMWLHMLQAHKKDDNSRGLVIITKEFPGIFFSYG